MEYPPPVAAAEMRLIYSSYCRERPEHAGIILPDLLPHDVCGVYPKYRRQKAVRVLFIAESPPWLAERRELQHEEDCGSSDYIYVFNDRYTRCYPGARSGLPALTSRPILSLGLAENLFVMLGFQGESRRENLEAFAGENFFLIDTIKCVVRKNRRATIPRDLIRVSAQEILAREIDGLMPGYIVALGATAFAGLKQIAPYDTILGKFGKITEISGEHQADLFVNHRLLCVPFLNGRNRRYLGLIESGFTRIRGLIE